MNRLTRLFRSYEKTNLTPAEEAVFDGIVSLPTKKYLASRHTLLATLLILNAILLFLTFINLCTNNYPSLTSPSKKNMTGIDASFFIFDTIITMALFCARANWNKFKPSTKWTRIIGCLYSFGLLLYMYLPYTSFIHFESSTTDDFFTRIKSLQNLFQMMTPCLLTINGTIECAKELYKIFPTVFEFNLIRKILMLVYIPLYVIIIGIVSQVCYNFATQYTGFLISFMIIYTIFLLSRNIYGVLVNVIFLFICEKLFGIQLLVLYLFALIKYFTIKLVIKDYLLHLILNKPGTFARPLNDELDVSTEIIADIKREYIEGYPLDAFGLIA